MSYASISSIPDEGVNQTLKKFKKFYKFYRHHSFIAPDTLSMVNYSHPPNPYRLVINSIENIHFSPKTQKANSRIVPCLKIFLTFYSKDRNKFFGRSYTSSSLLCLSANPNGTCEYLEPINIFYLTRLDKTSNILLSLELQILELGEKQELYYTQSIGWVEFSPFAEIKGRLNLKRGSASQLLHYKSNVAENTAIIVQYELIQSPELLRLKHLLPESVLYGFDEALPGIQGKKIQNNGQILLEPNFRFFFAAIQLLVPEAAEKEIIKIATKFRENKYEKTDKAGFFNDILISERRLVVVFHNGWTAINSRGYSNYSLLVENGIKDMGINKNNERIVYNCLEYSGIMEIDNVFPDEFGIFVFQLEYLITFTAPSRGKDSLKLILGWLPFSLTEEYFKHGEISMQEELLKGPCKNLNNERVADLTSLTEEQQIILMGNLGMSEKMTQGGGTFLKMQEPGKIGSMKSFNQFGGGGGFLHDRRGEERLEKYNRKSSPDEELKSRLFLNEQQKDMEHKMFMHEERLQKEIEEMRYLKEKQGQEYNSRESEYLRHIQALKDSTYNSDLKAQKDLEELKSMIQTLSKQREQDQDKIVEIKNQRDQPLLFDKLDQEKWKIIDGIISVPKKNVPIEDRAFVLQPDYNGKELSRADKAHLIQAGIRGLLDEVVDIDATNEETMERNLKLEMEDPLKASLLLIQFLGFRPKVVNFTKKTNSSDNEKGPNSIFGEDYYVPEKLYFTLNFFDFPMFKTEMVTFEGANEKGLSNMLAINQAMVFIKESYLHGGLEGKEVTYKFEVDPSISKSGDYYQEYIKYLYRKSLNIDLWDAETMMLYGTIKIPMKSLLRQGRQVATLTKEYDVIDPNMSRIKGSIQLLMKNIGKSPKVVEYRGDKKGVMVGRDGKIKRKIKSKVPLQLPKGHHKILDNAKYLNEVQNDPDKRIKERIKRHKMNFLEEELSKENMSVEILNKQDAETRQKLVFEITSYKEEKKPNFVKSVLTEYLSQERALSASFGKVEIIEFDFINKETQEQAFNITIDDSHGKILENPELTLIKNEGEWKFWVEKRGYNKPPEWRIISEENVFVLEPKRKVTFLFKYLSFRQLESENEKEPEENNLKGVRNINVYFNVLKGRVYDGFILRVEPHNSVIDHVFRYFERDNRQVELVLPALYYFSQAPISKPKLQITYPKTLVEWLNDREIMIQLKTPPIAKILTFNLLAYEDSYFSELIGNWVIEVNSFAGLDMNVKMGQLTTTTLSLPGDMPRVCRLYSSHPLTVYFPAPFDKSFPLTPGKINSIEINVRSFLETSQKVQINCVDINSRELVHGWILRIDTGAPNVTKIFEVTCKLGVESIQKFVYNNKSNSYAMFEFTSSHPDILQMIESKVAINGGDRETIRIRIPARHQLGQATVHIFAVDQDEKIFDCLQFKIRYAN